MSNEIKQGDNQELLQLVSFKIGNEEFGIDILKVQEIIRLMAITQIPNSPDFVVGVINLRGRVIPVIDLRVKLGLPSIDHNSSTRVVVVEINQTTVGFIVDAVSEVLRIPKSITEAPPAIVAGIESEYITSIAKLEDRLLIFLDLERVLTVIEKKSIELLG